MSDKAAPAISLIPAEMYHALAVAHAEVACLRMTDVEKDAIATAARIAGAVGESDIKATLQALLKRLKGLCVATRDPLPACFCGLVSQHDLVVVRPEDDGL